MYLCGPSPLPLCMILSVSFHCVHVQWQWIIIKQFLMLGKLMKNEHNMNKCMIQAYLLLLLLLLPQYALTSRSFFFKSVLCEREREREKHVLLYNFYYVTSRWNVYLFYCCRPNSLNISVDSSSAFTEGSGGTGLAPL